MKVHVNNLPNIQEIQRTVGTRLWNHASSSGDRQSAQDAVVINVRMTGGGETTDCQSGTVLSMDLHCITCTLVAGLRLCELKE